MDEFEIIQKYFATRSIIRSDVIVGSGDDCALLEIPAKQHLAVSIDTLIAGVHFPVSTSAFDIGYKSLAVNLSDLAAMAAEPAWATLSLTLTEANYDWLDNFAQGFFQLAKEFNVQLIGGDITRGSVLSITIQVHGFVPPNKALLRKGAQNGDSIYVTGSLGYAGLALQLINTKQPVPDELLTRLNRPTPRIAAGIALRNIANSAIDISDGLVADLAHILESSHVGATVELKNIPLSDYMRQNIIFNQAIELALSAGDDYELCFTVPTDHEALLKNVLQDVGCSYQKIGIIDAQPGLRLLNKDGTFFNLKNQGYKHF